MHVLRFLCVRNGGSFWPNTRLGGAALIQHGSHGFRLSNRTAQRLTEQSVVGHTARKTTLHSTKHATTHHAQIVRNTAHASHITHNTHTHTHTFFSFGCVLMSLVKLVSALGDESGEGAEETEATSEEGSRRKLPNPDTRRPLRVFRHISLWVGGRVVMGVVSCRVVLVRVHRGYVQKVRVCVCKNARVSHDTRASCRHTWDVFERTHGGHRVVLSFRRVVLSVVLSWSSHWQCVVLSSCHGCCCVEHNNTMTMSTLNTTTRRPHAHRMQWKVEVCVFGRRWEGFRR